MLLCGLLFSIHLNPHLQVEVVCICAGDFSVIFLFYKFSIAEFLSIFAEYFVCFNAISHLSLVLLNIFSFDKLLDNLQLMGREFIYYARRTKLYVKVIII